MNPIQILAAQPGVPRLGWTLLHFLWQGVGIAVVYAMARRRAWRSVPNVRYLLACAAMAAMAAAPLVTWLALSPSVVEIAATAPAAPLSATASGAVRSLPMIFSGSVSAAAATSFLTWVVGVWVAGASAFWVRLMGGWILAARLRSRQVLPAPAAWQATLDRLKARMHMCGPVRLLQSSLVQTPAVVGWLRPVVLAPAGALAGLPAEQMEALLLHELAHIRRYDYLVNLLQSAVEAVLFYHPAVWWVSGHMRDERELCCDDTAVSVSGDAVVYARALAGLGSLCQPVAMAANGGSLAHRIGRLLGHPRRAPRTLSGTGIVAAAVLPVIAAIAVFGQPPSRLKFEVASIKPAGEQGMRIRPLPNGLSGIASLKVLMERAYSALGFQIAGGPDWMESERFTIDAKAAGARSREQVNVMLQSLLEERFQLKIHRETRELPTFNLAIAKGGAKLPSPKDGGCEDSADPPPELTGGRMAVPGSGPEPVLPCGRLHFILGAAGARMYGGKIPMPELVRMLSAVLGRTVVDRTGFARLFDVQLNFLPDETTPLLPPPPPDAEAYKAVSPPILTALPAQLGLRLEATRGPVEILVIDHAERPTAN